MADKSKIQWTDATWNPTTGCAKVSAGCKHCYAERDWQRLSANPKTVYYGREFTDVMTHPDRLDQPLRWKKQRRIFVNSMGDLFHPAVPDEFIAAVFGVMRVADWHVYQILTKRPERMVGVVSRLNQLIDAVPTRLIPADGNILPKNHVWLGVSTEDQAAADERIPLLKFLPSLAVRWISAEPLIAPIKLHRVPEFVSGHVDWVVVGGESGPKARHMHPAWAYGLKSECETRFIPFFMKQMARKEPIPDDLMVRQWPGSYLDDIRQRRSFSCDYPAEPERI